MWSSTFTLRASESRAQCELVQLAILMTAAVYGRYHYMVDGLGGLAITVVAAGIDWLLERSVLA